VSLMIGRGSVGLGLLWMGWLLLTACVKAPDMVYMVDDQTALERQAAGEQVGLTQQLEALSISPRGAFFTRSALGEGAGRDAGDLGTLTELYSVVLQEADQTDALLVRHCIGEGLEGLLVATPEACVGTVDVNQMTRLLQRVNRNRRQIWAYLGEKTEQELEATVRQAWRTQHLKAVVCGAWIELEPGRWGEKAC